MYEILKHTLIFTEEFIREKGIHMFNTEDADSILKAIDLINIKTHALWVTMGCPYFNPNGHL